MIKAILLDVDGTLLDFDACAWESMKRTFEQWNLPVPDGLFSTFTTINNGLWHLVEEGGLTVPELYQIRWKRIFEALGVDADGARFEDDFLTHLLESACPVKDAPEVVKQLSERYLLAAATNAPYDQQKHRLELAGMLPYLDHLFISEEIGAAKPAPEFFNTCLERLPELRPEEILMVGDSLHADIQGCRAAGIHSCWFNPQHREGVPGIRPEWEITDLKELLGEALPW